MKYSAILGILLPLALAVMAAANPANPDVEEVEELLGDIAKNEKYPDDAQIEKNDIVDDLEDERLALKQKDADERLALVQQLDMDEFDDAKEMNESPAKAESNSNENVVIEQDEPYNVITEDDGGAKSMTYEEEMAFKDELDAKMEEHQAIEDYGDEQQETDPKIDDELVAKESSIIEEPDQTAEIEINSASLVTRYAGMGYNLLQANPEGDFNRGGVDPGIKTTRFVFKQTYSQGNNIFYQGRRMQVPDQVTFHQTHSCVQTHSTKAYSGQASYRKELSLNVEAAASYNGLLFSARFALSSGMQRAQASTTTSHSVIVQETKNCNYAQTRYKLANALSGAHGYELTENFKNAIRLLPSTYSAREYTQFLDNWGTHILEEVAVGTRSIKRMQASYNQVYSFLSQQDSNAISVSGSYGRGSGSVSIDINTLNQRVNQNTRFGRQMQLINIGTQQVPLPLHVKVVPISIALNDHLWDEASLTVIRRKKVHMKKALVDYPANKRARIGADPPISLQVHWPNGKYSMLETTHGCPSGWSSGWRYQDNEDRRNANRWSPSNIASYLKFGTGSNFKTYYCTKTHINLVNDNVFIWPRGKYCIARHGGSCPSHFYSGFRYWDDEDRRNANTKQGVLPDGSYGGNTKTEYCCRSDGNAHTEVLLPPTRPFVLYRYQGTCQKVKGMNNRSLYIYFDDEDSRNANRCGGHYSDGSCGGNHELHLCYYTPR
ncbi:uncharacterized protein LOC135349653 isoform X2 [Halichondria panicea]|uniref:uncharacterized protein LOC135349653 isoform X2 n=1 Tax=Halichondria panicea TaxID=6063 RepID=UPI00312B7E65